jgi:hypothetical protein
MAIILLGDSKYVETALHCGNYSLETDWRLHYTVAATDWNLTGDCATLWQLQTGNRLESALHCGSYRLETDWRLRYTAAATD